MALKKRNKTSAEFSMSSLTDIIFLLLIFFMLTSTLVKIEPFELPESDSKTVAPTSIVVAITKDGQHKIGNEVIPVRSLTRVLSNEIMKASEQERENYTVTIVAEVDTPFERVVNIMEIAARLKVNAIIATQPVET
ncbi:MAG TPA: biopolymer transporter ExbD [Saprospiraceae bacterium]|nr:biopolymer transporter ExbD [Saprospiraceae bacterium]